MEACVEKTCLGTGIFDKEKSRSILPSIIRYYLTKMIAPHEGRIPVQGLSDSSPIL
jgi:hypothetical protein